MTRFTTSLIAAAAAMVALPVAASAAPKPAEGEIPASTREASANESQRYCIVTTPTGSRLERRECKTLAAWQAAGVDPRKTK